MLLIAYNFMSCFFASLVYCQACTQMGQRSPTSPDVACTLAQKLIFMLTSSEQI